ARPARTDRARGGAGRDDRGGDQRALAARRVRGLERDRSAAALRDRGGRAGADRPGRILARRLVRPDAPVDTRTRLGGPRRRRRRRPREPAAAVRPAGRGTVVIPEGSIMSVRPIKRIAQSRPTIEGAGVKLRRAFGFGNTTDFDPFLLLDDFRNENPGDYLA